MKLKGAGDEHSKVIEGHEAFYTNTDLNGHLKGKCVCSFGLSFFAKADTRIQLLRPRIQETARK